MSKIKLLTIAVIILLLCNIGLMIFMHSMKSPHRNHDGPKKHIMEVLQLNDTQANQFEELIKQHQANIKTEENTMSDLKGQLYSGLVNEMNVEQHDSLVNELGKIQSGIERIHYKHFEDIRSLCNEEQQKNFNTLANELSTLFSNKMHSPEPAHK